MELSRAFIKQEMEMDFGSTLNQDDLCKMNIKKEVAEKTLVQLLNEQNLAEDINQEPKAQQYEAASQDEGYFSGESSSSSEGSCSPESNGNTSPETKGGISPDGHQTQDFEKMVPPKEISVPLAPLSAESVEKTLSEAAQELSEAILYYEDVGPVKQEFSFQSSYQPSQNTAYYMAPQGPSYQVENPQPISYQVQKPEVQSGPSKARAGMENLVVMKNPGLTPVYYRAFQTKHTCYYLQGYPCHSCAYNQYMWQSRMYHMGYQNSSWSMAGQGQTQTQTQAPVVQETKPQVWSRKMSTLRIQKTDKGIDLFSTVCKNENFTTTVKISSNQLFGDFFY